MKKKTYAARGLLDFQMAINIGGAILRLCFSGGSMGFNGVVSAKYSTDNPAIQKMIEKSPHFLNHRVYLYSEETINVKDITAILPGKSAAVRKEEDDHTPETGSYSEDNQPVPL